MYKAITIPDLPGAYKTFAAAQEKLKKKVAAAKKKAAAKKSRQKEAAAMKKKRPRLSADKLCILCYYTPHSTYFFVQFLPMS